MDSFERNHGGTATILAIGTAYPPNFICQADYPDYYFQVTKSDHLTEVKDKFRRMCEKSMIRKRHFHLTEEILIKHPNIATYDTPSLDARQDILVTETPKLGKQAALNALKEWGQSISRITHLVFSAFGGVDMPGLDSQLINLLGLDPSVKRIMLHQQGCYAGATVLRIAKDIAENNPFGRVLVVCSDMTVGSFRGPSEADLPCLVGQAITSDGAAALVVGASPAYPLERPLFRIISAAQTLVPDSLGAIQGHLREMGLTTHISKDVSRLVSENIGDCLVETFSPIGVSDWNSLFWIVHPGGAPILDKIEAKVGLKQEKLWATRRVLSEYGNMGGPTVFFIIDEMRRKSLEEKKATTGEGLEWGVLFGYGAGLTIDTVVLRSVVSC